LRSDALIPTLLPAADFATRFSTLSPPSRFPPWLEPPAPGPGDPGRWPRNLRVQQWLRQSVGAHVLSGGLPR